MASERRLPPALLAEFDLSFTGVFLPVGSMLYIVDRLEAESVLPEILRFPLTSRNTTFEARGSRYVTIHHKDCLYATATRERGFDTLLMERNPEGAPHLISASTGCMDRRQPLQTGCVPVGLRTGWKGDRACSCTDAAGHPDEGLSTVVNCASS